MITRDWKPRAFLSIGLAIALSDFAYAAPISGQGTWESTLQGRDLDGDLGTFEAYYDTALDITWLTDANHAQTGGHDSDGRMSWFSANQWAASLNPYGSNITGWRLPTLEHTAGVPGCVYYVDSSPECVFNVDTDTSEMAHMFYVSLGNKAFYDASGNSPQEGWGLTNSGPFSNIQDTEWLATYWFDSYYDLDQDFSWKFDFSTGYQNIYPNFEIYDLAFAWAVHDGDVGASAVPLPAAGWLFISGMTMLAGIGASKRGLR
jgi:hypothetical protein